MTRMMAFCGLACDQCPAFVATQTDDDQKRREVARQWSELFKTDISPRDINCDGCHSETGRLFGHCHVCEIRACSMQKNLSNCGQCKDYPCQRLDFIFKAEPEARERLDVVREKWSET